MKNDKKNNTLVEWRVSDAIHPGEFLKDAIEENNVSQIELAKRIGVHKKLINDIVNGKNPITRETAYKLSKIFELSTEYWVNLQKIYEDSLIKKMELERLNKEALCYIDSFKDTYKELASYELVKKMSVFKCNYSQIILELQKYFAVDSLGYVSDLNLGTEFRKYKRKNINNNSLAAWLRIGQRIIKKTQAPEFNRNKLINSIEDLRQLSFEKPEEYLLKIKKILLDCGVVLVYAPLFKNTYVQGATKWEGDNVFVMLKTTNQSEDKFWFNLFHELGHIVKHGKKDTYINLENGNDSEEKEVQADRFAQKKLIPNFSKLFRTKDSMTKDIEFISKEEKISKAIVAGRIAHELRDNNQVWKILNNFVRKINYFELS